MNQIARKEIDVLRDELSAMTGQFAMALPAQIPPERFVRVAMTALQNDPKLMQCERRSLWNAFMKCAQDGLLPDGREAVVVAYNTKVKGAGGQDRYELMAQYQPMIAGIRKKVRNSGVMADFYADVIHERDEWEIQKGDDPYIRHRPNLLVPDRGKIIVAYSVAFLKDGTGKSLEAISVHEVERRRAMSKSPDSPAWKNHYAEMCKKTVARLHSKILPMSTDLDDLFRRDDEANGAADIPALPPSERPQLADFSAGSQDQPGPETAASDAPRADNEPSKRRGRPPRSEGAKTAEPGEEFTAAGKRAGAGPSRIHTDPPGSDMPDGRGFDDGDQSGTHTGRLHKENSREQADPETGELPPEGHVDVENREAANHQSVMRPEKEDLEKSYLLGRRDRKDGRAFSATPLHFREPGYEEYREQWRRGWRDEDEATKAKKG